MSKSQSRIPSPARSHGAITPRRTRTRRTLSTASPAQAESRLSTVVERFVKNDKFVLSPMKRRSVLPDDTDIEAPRRASWWKRLEGSSRDVLEALDTNKMSDDLLEEYEFEVEKDDKQSQSVQQSQSSDNESVASIVVPQRRLFNQKKQSQGKFGDILGSRKSLGKTNIEDQSIEDAPKTLFNKGPRNKPIFPAALLNSTNKTINKTVEPETNKQARPNLFGQAGGKRKNMFTDFVLSDSEEDSEVQHKVFGFKKNNKRISLGTRNRRMPSLTPSMTTEIDIDDWNLLPSSTMIGTQENSRMSDKDMELQDENQDDTLTENKASLYRSKQRKSIIPSDENDKTLTNENIEDGIESQENKVTDESKKVNRSKTKLNESAKDKTSQNKVSKLASNLTNAENVEIDTAVVKQQQATANDNGRFAENEQSLEDKMAQLHGENVVNEESPILPNKTEENNIEGAKTINYVNGDKGLQDLEQNAKIQEFLSESKAANNTKHNESLLVRSKTQEVQQTDKGQNCRDVSRVVVTTNQNEEMEKIPEDDNNEEAIETNVDEERKKYSVAPNETHHEVVNYLPENDESEIEASEEEAEEATKSNQDEDMDNSKEEVEPSVDEQNRQDRSLEASKTIQNENMGESEEEQEESEDEKEQSEEVQEQSDEEQVQSEEEQEQSDEEQGRSEEEEEESDKEEEQTEEQEQTQEQEQTEEQELSIEEHESHNQSEGATKTSIDKSHEQMDEDEDMEEMVWNDNDDGKLSDASEKNIKQIHEARQTHSETRMNLSELKQDANKSKNNINKSKKIVDAPVDNDNIEEENEVVEVTPNNSTHDTTGRNRKREVSKVKSPEAVLQNVTNDNESFRPIGRSTTFRKSKSVYETMNMRHSLAPVQESTLGSEGSRNSSTEGSEWDSHRTTRKTIRQTLGKEYTTRKSLRALVMEQSAKRQTEAYNKTSKFDKTKNRTIADDGSGKNSSKMNKTKNKTVIEDGNNKNASTMNKTKNKTVLEDINDQHIRFRRTSNRNISSNMSPNSKSPVHGTSTNHVPDPLISEHQPSYHKSHYDIKESEMSKNLTNPEDSANIPIPENDSEPEISMNASYGEGMTASGHDVTKENSEVEMLDKENTSPKFKNDISRRGTSRSLHNSDQEVLDYEASEQVISGLDQDNSDHEESEQDEKDSESENEEEIESEKEESEQENDSQQEIEADSEHEETQEDIEEESQEIEQEQSQQEVESDQEESQEMEQEPDSEEEQNSEESNHDISHESAQESDQDMSREQENESDQDDFISALNSKNKTPETKRGVSRIVFDSNMMSVDEIDFEGVSRSDNNITENESVRAELRESLHRASEASVNVSVGTKKSILFVQMQKIAQQNMERRQKIRDKVQKSLKPTRNFPIQDIGLKLPKYSIRRPQAEPRKPKRPKPTGVPADALPKAFAEDLMYKPPKRFQPANAPWITKRLYKFLETKLEPKYDYRARVRAEELVQSIFSFSKLVRRRDAAPAQAVDELKKEMARLRVVTTHYEFYDFFHEFMPREIRIKVNPDVVNKIPMPKNGVFSEILQTRAVVE